MSLLENLANAKSEEDVKDAYIKALGLKKHTKGLIDIQTDEVWFEAKLGGKNTYHSMFTQLLHYVQLALNQGEPVPPLLAVIDTEKAALMKSSEVLPFLEKRTIKWGKSATKYTPEALAAISAHIGTHYVAFRIETDADVFIGTVKAAIKTGEIVRTQITPDNLKQVFDKWVAMIGREVIGIAEKDYDLLFFADIMHDGTVATHADLPAQLLFKNGKPAFQLGKEIFDLASTAGYVQFWAMYHRPPREQYRNYLLERRDSLIPLDERGFKGAFYTPLHVVDKAYDYLRVALGANWQDRYIVWDMCCGVGNLEVKHSNHRKLFMSTLDAPDINVMKSTKTCVAATRFQYDYLNDDIADDGSIDYKLSKKLPGDLIKAIAEGKQLLVLINPPYAEAMKADNVADKDEDTSEAKSGVAKTRVATCMDSQGYASRELFTQFLVRIAKEMPTAKVAIFSKLKYVNAPNFEVFRANWNAQYLGGFVVHSKAFDGLKGDFPIGFLIWAQKQNAKTKTPITEIKTDVLDKNAVKIGTKSFFNISGAKLLGEWIDRPRPNDVEALPLKSALTPTTSVKDVRGTRWADGAIGGMICNGSDMQHAALSTALLSSGYGNAGAFLVTEANLWQSAVVFASRLLIKKTWQNDRDQLLAPTKPLSEQFKNDCLIWMLFNGQNLAASADGLQWNGKKWSLVNHFIPFTESEVGSPDRFESDFMVRHIGKLKLSPEARAVMSAGRAIWKHYFSEVDAYDVRKKYCLNRPDVGWYQVRMALKARGTLPEPIAAKFAEEYSLLGAKLRPQVYEVGILLA
jgi:hypothetical protein